MSEIKIIPDPKGRPKHWLVDGQLVAGAETAEDALTILQSLNDPGEAPEPVCTVSKYTIITRLEQAGKFDEALAALKSDDLLYEKWSAVSEIKNTDQPARALFASIGLDPDVILAVN